MLHISNPGPSPSSENAPLPQLRRELRSWTRDLAVALGLALVIIIFLYQPVKVEGTSMAPLLSDQERIFINKFVYRFEPIGRGDVVVFWYPKDPSVSFIKRVIAVPGDTVELRRGALYVNNVRVDEPYLLPQFSDGESHPAVDVPKGYYYVLGDHRNSSNDSRTWGEVPEKYIYGKAIFRFWPLGKIGVIR